MKNTNKSIKYYSRRQRILAWLVLFGIFVCGMMAGAFIWQTKTVYTAKYGVETELSACQMLENALLAQLYKNIDDSRPGAYEAHEYNMHVYEKLYKNGEKIPLNTGDSHYVTVLSNNLIDKLKPQFLEKTKELFLKSLINTLLK